MKSEIIRYCKEKFNIIQQLDGITAQMMMDSLDINVNREMIFKAGEGSGKSGSFFFFSKDNKFLIKTLKKSEKQLFLNMIDDYIDHIQNGESLLARIYGIYSIET